MKITIKDIQNGAVVTYHAENDEEVDKTYAYEYDEKNPEKFIELLQDIKEALGLFNVYDKFAAETKKVIIALVNVHGHKHDCEIKDCKLCKIQKAVDVVYGE